MNPTSTPEPELLERYAGILTFIALILGIVVVNSPYSGWYDFLHHLPFHVGIGDQIFLSLIHI